MSIKVNQNQYVLSTINSYTILGEKNFLKKYGYIDEFAESPAITSFDIEDSINVFTIEKENGENKSISCLSLNKESFVKDLIKKTKDDDYINSYDIYIIGGNSSTTEGKDCLLNNIHEAIKATFNSASKIKLQLINLEEKTSYKFVSVNLKIDGTLTLCHHKQSLRDMQVFLRENCTSREFKY